MCAPSPMWGPQQIQVLGRVAVGAQPGGCGRLREAGRGSRRLREVKGGWGMLGEAERLSSLVELSVCHISSMEATVPDAAPKQSL